MLQSNTGKSIYPLDLQCMQCSRSDVRKFAEEAKEIGIQYLGLCCGSSSNMLREIAEVYGRTPPSSIYKPDIAKSFVYGDGVKGHAQKVANSMRGNTVIQFA